MNQVLADAGPLIALFDRNDGWHLKVKAWLRDYKGKLITCWPVITEVVHMLDFHPQAPIDFLKWIRMGGIQIYGLQQTDLGEIIFFFEKYRDLPADLADTSLLWISHETGIRRILTIDSDFQVYKRKDGTYLENVLVKPRVMY